MSYQNHHFSLSFAISLKSLTLGSVEKALSGGRSLLYVAEMSSIEYLIILSQKCTFLKPVDYVVVAGFVAPFSIVNMHSQFAISGVHFFLSFHMIFLIQMLHLTSLQSPTK